MGTNAVSFIKALGLPKVDVLGFSIGGFVAQEIILRAPDLVRRLVLVGTGPRGGEGMATLTPEAREIFGATYDEPDHLWLRVHFTRSEKSQAAGREFLKRFRLRAQNRDPEVNEKVAPAQIEAISKWGAPREKPFEYLKSIRQPTLVVNGDNDVIIYSVNSFILQRHLPNAQLILYPDANHGSSTNILIGSSSTFLSSCPRSKRHEHSHCPHHWRPDWHRSCRGARLCQRRNGRCVRSPRGRRQVTRKGTSWSQC
jgi:pimeloyl-ACP methyl ester carboxylesterase